MTLLALAVAAALMSRAAAPEDAAAARALDMGKGVRELLGRVGAFRLRKEPRAPSASALFQELDRDPWLRGRAGVNSIAAFIDLLGIPDLPPELLERYRRRAGSAGGGRVLLGLDYTRGTSPESWREAARRGAKHLLVSKLVVSRAVHSRPVGGQPAFPVDDHFPAAFRDSAVWGGPSNQVGHLLGAVEIGFAVTKLQASRAKSALVTVALKAAGKVQGWGDIEADPDDWARAILVGHELAKDNGSSGVLYQTGRYNALVTGGDPRAVRSHFDSAVEAALRDDHWTAWEHIRALAAAGEMPWIAPSVIGTPMANPRYANSGQDLALSIYGYATGIRSARGDFGTVEAVQAHFRDRYTDLGLMAPDIERQSGLPNAFSEPSTDAR